MFLAEPLYGVIALPLLLIDCRDGASRAAQAHPHRTRSGDPLIKRAQLRILAEYDRLEVVAAEAADASPGAERIGIERHRPPRGGGAVLRVPPGVCFGGCHRDRRGGGHNRL